MQIKLGKPSASALIYPLACALVVIGAKCWMIGRYGNPTPFWDQWDAEGAVLYPRYLGGTLQLADLIAPHNEHRILMTRLWSLLLLELEGYWDPILQMLANTLILGAVIAVLVAAFRPLLTTWSWTSIAAFTTVMFALPFAWENTLQGFNSQWYFLLLISLAGLLVCHSCRCFYGTLVVGDSTAEPQLFLHGRRCFDGFVRVHRLHSSVHLQTPRRPAGNSSDPYPHAYDGCDDLLCARARSRRATQGSHDHRIC